MPDQHAVCHLVVIACIRIWKRLKCRRTDRHIETVCKHIDRNTQPEHDRGQIDNKGKDNIQSLSAHIKRDTENSETKNQRHCKLPAKDRDARLAPICGIRSNTQVSEGDNKKYKKQKAKSNQSRRINSLMRRKIFRMKASAQVQQEKRNLN